MSNEEVSLSIEETNKLRASLGLKPLQAQAAPAAPAKPPPAQEESAAARDAAALRERLAGRREQRRQAELAATQGLGEADPVVDDIASWVSRQRTAPAAAAAAAAPRAAGGGSSSSRKRPRGQEAPAGGADSDGERDGNVVPELAGAKVKGDVSALAEGETLVLTLADAPLLDDKGSWDEEAADTLENALQAQEAARAKARRAANAHKPLWQEDGRVRGLLDKYDEEEAEAVAAFDEAGQLAAAAAHAAGVQRRLAENAAGLDAAGNGVPGEQGGGDYQTPAEVAAAEEQQLLKKKKKKRKLRKAGGEEGAEQQQQQQQAGGGLDLDALEAEAAAAGAADRDRGSRADRSSRAEAAAAKAAAAAADKKARFGAALEKANWASTFLRPGAAAPSTGDDPGDEELVASLARARRMAQQAAAAGGSGEGGDGGSSMLRTEDLAAQLAARRAADELQEQAALTARADDLDLFTETTEFVRSVQVGGPTGDGGAATATDGAASPMDLDLEGPLSAPRPAASASVAGGAPPKQRKFRKAGWVELAAEGGEQEATANGSPQRTDDAEQQTVTNEVAVGKGLGAALALLKETGALKNKVEWGGRTNDRSAVALQGLETVFTGGSSEDAREARIEAALTRRDAFGRVMTPKDNWRQLNYDFHGMQPSKKQQEKIQRQYLQQVATKQATTSANPSAAIANIAAVQQQLGTAYIPLTGKLARAEEDEHDEDAPLPGDVSMARVPGIASSAVPSLGGGSTPLVGRRKVEAMLGIASTSGSSSVVGGKGSMPPPARRPPQH